MFWGRLSRRSVRSKSSRRPSWVLVWFRSRSLGALHLEGDDWRFIDGVHVSTVQHFKQDWLHVVESGHWVRETNRHLSFA